MIEEYGKREKKRFLKKGEAGRGASGRKNKVPSPPRVLLCHCLKCDDKWRVGMQLIADPEASKEKSRSKYKQQKMVWVFPPESFESCNSCGSKTVTTISAKTDMIGRIKLHMVNSIPVSLSLEDDLTMGDYID